MLYIPQRVWQERGSEKLFFVFEDENGNHLTLQINPGNPDSRPRLFYYEKLCDLKRVERNISRHADSLYPQDFRILWTKKSDGTSEIGVNRRPIESGYCG